MLVGVAAICTVASVAAVPAGRAVAAAPRTLVPSPGLELFVHPARGGGWSSRPLSNVSAGAGTPSVAASRGGRILIAQRTSAGDVTVSEGSVAGSFATRDLTQSLAAPSALGRPFAFLSTIGAASVWYRTSLGDLEVLTQAEPTGAWTATDVSSSVGSSTIAGDPTVVASGTTEVGYAVTPLGTVERFSPPTRASATWVASDPTDGLTYTALTGNVAALSSPDDPAATILLGRTSWGDVVELTDEVVGPPVGVGTWRAADLTDGGIPSATSPFSEVSGSSDTVTYLTWSSDVIALSITSAGRTGVRAVDLTEVSDLNPASGARPMALVGPGGPSVAVRTTSGDLLVASATTATSVDDVSFEPHTAELIAADPGVADVDGAAVLVAAAAGPIAPTPLLRRIVLRAASFDQQHRGYQTVPRNSNCNPFSAAMGRGSTGGCPRGTAAEEWCSDFAQYIWQTSGVPTAGISGWSATFATWGAKHHTAQFGTRFHAAPGDAIVWGQRTPLYGTHVGIIVSVDGKDIEVVSGNSNGDFPRYGSGVWRWGPFDGATSRVNGYAVLAVVAP